MELRSTAMPHCTPQGPSWKRDKIHLHRSHMGRKNPFLNCDTLNHLCTQNRSYSLIHSFSHMSNHFTAILTETTMCPANTMKDPSEPPVQKGALDITPNLTRLSVCQLRCEKERHSLQTYNRETCQPWVSHRRLPGESDQVET